MNNYVSTFFNQKNYRMFYHPFLFKFSTSPITYWLAEDNQSWIFAGHQPAYFLKNNVSWLLVRKMVRSFFENFSVWAPFFKFRWFRFVLFSGLGYKRRFFSRLRLMMAYTADRHWILYRFRHVSTVIPTKKRNFVFFSLSKGWFSRDYDFFSDLRTPYVYKTKGFLDRRIKRRFLFARRIRLRSVKTKLSKKQQML